MSHGPTRSWPVRLSLRLLWTLPVAWLVWWLLTPLYNRFLVEAGQNLVRLAERPSMTVLAQPDVHHFMVTREDGSRAGGRLPYSVRTTDLHFPTVLLWGLFLAVPGVSWSRRFEALGYATLISVVFHLVDLVFWVEFVYATQLGAWSAERYGDLAQNFWGLGKHLLDLPFKLGLPLVLWAVFFWGELGGRPGSPPDRLSS